MRLRPHGRVLVLPAAVLVAAMGAGGFAAARVPEGDQQLLLRGLVALAVLVVVLRASALPFLRWVTTTLTVTDRRVRTRQGILRSRVRDVWLWRVEDVVVERSLLQRLTRSGTLVLETTGERRLVLRDVPGVHSVADELGVLLEELGDDREQEWFDAEDRA
jgi:uncharacterized membrane protein YdbT with pleckstrin-like domain